jgi:hypothetical protein
MDARFAILFDQKVKGFLENGFHEEILNELSDKFAEKIELFSDDITLLEKYPNKGHVPMVFKNVKDGISENDVTRALQDLPNKFPNYYNLQVVKY